MKDNVLKYCREESVTELLNKQYIESENKEEIDYWEPLGKIIVESIESRDLNNLSQTDVAKLMKTKQSVISRFENMGRLPNYDFIARLALALGHSPGITLYGDFMATVSSEKQEVIRQLAKRVNLPTKYFVQNILDEGIKSRINSFIDTLSNDANAATVNEDYDINRCNANILNSSAAAVMIDEQPWAVAI